MAHEKTFQDWIYVGNILSMIANVNRDNKKSPRPFTFMDFHPLMTEEEKMDSRPTVDIKVLKGLFTDGREQPTSN